MITLEQAKVIIESAKAKASENAMMPLSIVVLDSGGHLKAFERQDGASMLRFKVAHGKAYGAIGLGVGSRTVEAMALARPYFIAAVNGAVDGALVPVAGGVLVVDGEGNHLGAVGVSGDNSDNDEIAAVAGIEAAGFSAVTG